ncbi:hypothetical protein IE53DRAFT_389884, partial [Violaceomyces palustris]
METKSGTEEIDIGALQAQMELDRSSLADKIMSRLSGMTSSPSTISKVTNSKPATASPRPANLGVGATPSSSSITNGLNSKGNSIADARLKGKLLAKRKRDGDQVEVTSSMSKGVDEMEEDEEDDTKSKLVVSQKRTKASKREDPFSVKSKKERPNPYEEGEDRKGLELDEVEVVKLSKAARKKLNKKRREEEEARKALEEMRKAESKGTAKEDVEMDLNQGPPKEQKAEQGISIGQSEGAIRKSTSEGEGKRKRKQKGSESESNESGGPSTNDPEGPVFSGGMVSKPLDGSGHLTPLQSSMLSKLAGSRFRTINETLYTTPSTSALKLMRENPSTFDEYHQGFREQVKGWPKNPVDRIAEMLDPSRSSNRPATMGKKAGQREGSSKAWEGGSGGKVRARSTPGALIVDLGAGEAGLAKKLVPKGLRVLSYDLLDSPDGWVKGLDAARLGSLPLPGKMVRFEGSAGGEGSKGVRAAAVGGGPSIVDVAVFCLSLMGTNWVEMLIEARRVLRVG